MTSRKMALRILTLLTLGFVGIIFVPLAYAQSTNVIVQVGPLPPDLCPNIAGLQAAVPSGMITDTNGDCVTPVPPPVDVCANIAGVQTSIPSGYYQDTNGDCIVQPAPPVDVCPNIYGLQVIVPSSLIVDVDGNCIAPPIDECPNIPGSQSEIPDGMVFQDNACSTPAGTISPSDYTPPATTPQTTTPPQSNPIPGYTGPIYKNVPEALSPILNPIVQAIPEPVKQVLKSVPVEVARTVPYYISGVLGMASVVVAVQIVRELFAARTLIGFLRRDKNIADQKDNFIALASHYLRTPLTLMRNGLDTIIALKELPAANTAQLRKVVESLDENIKGILADIEENDALSSIKAPNIRTKEPHVLRSATFWVPVVTTIGLSLASNFLLGVVADVELGTLNLLFQIVVLGASGLALYSVLRNIYIKRLHREHQERLVEHERAVDDARNAFINRSTAALQHGLTELYNAHDSIAQAPSARFFDEGYTRFSDILQKFLLLGQIQTGTTRNVEPINLRAIIDTALGQVQSTVKEKQLIISNEIDPTINVTHNKALFYFVIQSLIDNAVKFNTSSGHVTITANPSKSLVYVSITDDGIGIPREKLPQLFKPFSRAGSAIEFNYDGLGFSLFLDKIITDYMGGSIKAVAPQAGGTAVTVTTPLIPVYVEA